MNNAIQSKVAHASIVSSERGGCMLEACATLRRPNDPVCFADFKVVHASSVSLATDGTQDACASVPGMGMN